MFPQILHISPNIRQNHTVTYCVAYFENILQNNAVKIAKQFAVISTVFKFFDREGNFQNKLPVIKPKMKRLYQLPTSNTTFEKNW